LALNRKFGTGLIAGALRSLQTERRTFALVAIIKISRCSGDHHLPIDENRAQIVVDLGRVENQ
jgi:hypothetical protein